MFKFLLLACFATAVLGIPHPPKARIAGSHDVDIKQYPYHVQLHTKTTRDDGSSFTVYSECNGAIISPNHVVTTASCINHYKYGIIIDPLTIFVKVNASVIYEYNGEPATYVQVKDYTLHPLHSNENDIVNVDYNVGVLELIEPLEFGSGIQPIDLPQKNEHPVAGSVLSVTGFGAKNYGGVLHVDSPLQALQAIVVENKKCTVDFIGNVVITERQVCTGSITGEDNVGPCVGDNGSPAAFEGILHGLYTYGDCGRDGHGSVYTSVGGVVDFINDVIAPSNN